MPPVDRILFRAINGWPSLLNPVLVPFSIVHDERWFRHVILAIVVAMAWRGGKCRRAALLSLVAFPVADWLCTVLKNAFPHSRPYQELTGVIDRVGLSESAGTASSHASNLAAVATVMTLGLGLRWGAPWIAIAVLVGISRVFVGAHYPWQVLLGWSVGVFLGWIVDGIARLVVRTFARPLFVEQP